MFSPKKIALIVMLSAFSAFNSIAALACATCGCSELCPLVMIEDTDSQKNPKGLLSESIWGSIILKMAYQRDGQLQKLKRHIKTVNFLTGASIAGAVGGTLGQNIISEATLNPPPPQFDSYLPGSLGLGMSGLVNIGLDGSMLLNWPLKKKIKARQLEIQTRVEAILHHLEFSEAYCPEAQVELAGIIGETAAKDCVKLWKSSHATASLPPSEMANPEASGQQNAVETSSLPTEPNQIAVSTER